LRPIGILTALAALAADAAVFLTDVQAPKLALAGRYPGITPVNVREQNLAALVREATDGWGANIVFEASGNERAAQTVFEPLCPADVWCSSGFRGAGAV